VGVSGRIRGDYPRYPLDRIKEAGREKTPASAEKRSGGVDKSLDLNSKSKEKETKGKIRS
jgi:hypothetical protein